MFPLSEIPTIKERPEDYRLLRRIPWTFQDVTFPIHIAEPVGDEVPMVWVDVETTGFDVCGKDKIIELGMVKGRVSPSAGQVTTITAMTSMYEDPGFPIPALITDITGITDNMVRRKVIDPVAVLEWFDDDPIVVAHNARFDRCAVEARFAGLTQLRWACSIKDIPWYEFGFESSKLEYLLLKLGYFYEGHRASIDALATAFLMQAFPKACRQLLENEKRTRVKIEALGSPFEVKDQLKSRGYAWNPDGKVWHTEVGEDDLDAELAYLSTLYPSGGDRARKTELGSRERYNWGGS